MGVSYGGSIAMGLAIHYPHLVASLILSGAAPSRTMSENFGNHLVAMGQDARAQFILDLVLTPEGQANDPQLVADTKRALRGVPQGPTHAAWQRSRTTTALPGCVTSRLLHSYCMVRRIRSSALRSPNSWHRRSLAHVW